MFNSWLGKDFKYTTSSTEAIGSRYSLVKLDMCILEWTSKVSRFCLHNFNRRTIKEPLFRTISFQYFHTLNVNLHVSQMKSRAHDNYRFPFLPCRYNRAWKIDHCIVKSFLPLLHCATEEFRDVPNSKGIVHKLKDLKWDSKNVIRHFQEARESLLLVRNNQ